MPTFPSTPKPTGVSITSINQVYSNKFQNMSTSRSSNGAQRWEVTLKYPTLNNVSGQALFAFIMARRGSLESFDFSLPGNLGTTSGTHTGGGLTVTSIVANGSTVNINGLTAQASALVGGDFIKFASHEKIYMITDTVTGTGTADAISIIPPLAISLTAGEVVTVDNITLSMTLKNKDQTFILDENQYYTLSDLKLEEAFNVPVGVI